MKESSITGLLLSIGLIIYVNCKIMFIATYFDETEPEWIRFVSLSVGLIGLTMIFNGIHRVLNKIYKDD